MNATAIASASTPLITFTIRPPLKIVSLNPQKKG